MNKSKTTLIAIPGLFAAALVMSACSSDEAPSENVFKDQTDAIGKAEEANELLEQAAQAQRRAIEEQSQ